MILTYVQNESTHNPFLEFCNIYDANSPEKAMINACNALINKSRTRTFPIIFDNILKECDARIEEKDLPNPGRLEIEDTGYVIYVDKKMLPTRKRFTIAHEIGHIILIDALFQKPDLIRKLRHTSNWFIVEKLCDKAASEILMPEQSFIHQIKKNGLTPEGIDVICNYFGVSRESFFIKFINIFNPSAVVLCKSQSTGTAKILPEIVDYFSTIESLPIKKGPLGSNNINQNIIKVAIKNGRAWSNSLINQINGKEVKILRIALLTSNSVHYKKIQQNSSSEYGLEKDYRLYDVILFYLPLNIMNNLIDLLEVIRN